MEVQKSYNFTFYRFIKSVYPDLFNFECVYKSVITKSKKSVERGNLYVTTERPNSGVYNCTVEHVASGHRKSFVLDVTFKEKNVILGEQHRVVFNFMQPKCFVYLGFEWARKLHFNLYLEIRWKLGNCLARVIDCIIILEIGSIENHNTFLDVSKACHCCTPKLVVLSEDF